VSVRFDGVIELTALRVWNCAQPPCRGVRELFVFLDGRLVHGSGLRIADHAPPAPTAAVRGQVLLLTDDEAARVRALRSCDVLYCGRREQAARCVDEGVDVTASETRARSNNAR
jgi:hypothetical protein